MKPQVFWPIIVVLVLALVVVLASVFTVSEHEQAIVVQFGSHRRTITEAGLHWRRPFVQTIHRYEKRVLLHDGAAAEYLTRDRKRVLVDHVTLWRVADPLEFYQRVRTEAGARNRLDEIVTARLRQEVARHEFLDLIRSERDAIIDLVTQDVQTQAAGLGIQVVHTRIKRTDLPREVQSSVFARMDAERNRIASRYRAEGEERALGIRADADRQREVLVATAEQESRTIRGAGDAEAAAIYAAAYGRDEEFFAFWRRLQAYERILHERSSMVLTSGSDLLRYLQQPGTRLPPTGAGDLLEQP
jgi:modulator of FtsH protease HflC